MKPVITSRYFNHASKTQVQLGKLTEEPSRPYFVRVTERGKQIGLLKFKDPKTARYLYTSILPTFRDMRGGEIDK